MKNKFINNNGATLLNTKNKKTLVESRIDELKQQEQKIITELWSWETKQKKAERLTSYLDEVERFSTKHLAEALEVEKDKENRNDYQFENLIKNASEFVLKFEPASAVFNQLVCQKIENQVSYLKSQLRGIQSQLAHQERIFARIEIRRQGRILLDCKLNNRLGCLGVYQCDNCRANYSVVNNHQAVEMQSIPRGQISK